MNYNKIKEEISRKNFNENFFIPENSRLTVQGFNKALKNKTLKVEDLISISKGLKLPMSYWFQDEDQSMVEDSKIIYGESSSLTIQRQNRQIDKLMNENDRLIRENDELKVKLGFGKSGS